MPITLFGILWLSGLFIGFFSKKPHILLGMLLFGMVFQSTNVIILPGGKGVGPQLITSMIFIIRSICFGGRLYIEVRKEKIWFGMLLGAMLAGLVVNHALDGRTILFFIQYLMYVICFFQLMKYQSIYDRKIVEKIIIGITWFVVIEGYLQFLMSGRILPKPMLFKLLFYNDTAGDDATLQFLLNKRYWRLFATFMEPSYCGAFLAGSLYYFAIQPKAFEENKFLVVCILGAIALTGSSTAYMATLIGGIFFALIGNNRKLILTLLPFAIIVGAVAFAKRNTIQAMIDKKMASDSGFERNKWNKYALIAYLKNPIFGVGYKQQRASSFHLSLLCQVGTVGAIAYVLSVLNLLLHRLRTSSQALIGAKIGLVSCIAAQVIACPDMDFCVFWYFMFLIAIFYNDVFNRKGNYTAANTEVCVC